MKSAQAKIVRRKLLGKALIALAAFTVLYWAFMALFGQNLYQQAAYLYADMTAPWHYVEKSTFETLQSANGDAGELVANSPFVSSSSMAPGEVTYSYDLGFWTDGSLYAVRDLSGYHAFLSGRAYVFVGLFFIGALAIGLVLLSRAIRPLDELCGAVTTLLEDPSKPIALSDSLSAIRGELSAIQLRNLSDQNAAKMAEQRKNEMVAYLAHDIRTPLTSVIGYLELLQDSPELPVEQRAKYTSIAHDKAVQLEGLVSEFFDITRYNLQTIPIERENIDVELFCEQLAEEFFPEAQERGLVLDVKAPAGETAFIDPEKMARALGNVLRNALAFADAQSVVSLEAQVHDTTLIMQVTDTGKEISPAHLQSIFDKFYREDSARSTQGGGTGLGLAIAREIVEAHGGTISAASENGVTTFTIEVPR